MKKIILFTSKNCPRCPEAYKLLKEVADLLRLKEGKDYEIRNIDEEENLLLALQYQVASTPSFVIGDEAIFIGEVPTKEELIKAITS